MSTLAAVGFGIATIGVGLRGVSGTDLVGTVLIIVGGVLIGVSGVI